MSKQIIAHIDILWDNLNSAFPDKTPIKGHKLKCFGGLRQHILRKAIGDSGDLQVSVVLEIRGFYET